LIGGKIRSNSNQCDGMNGSQRHVNKRSGPALAGLSILLLCISPPVFAYLDPSTGSMVVSAIVGIFASIALAMKTYWYKIKGFFKRDRKQDPTPRDSSD
jgi:amino acid permease